LKTQSDLSKTRAILSQSNHVIAKSRDHTALSLLFYLIAQVSKQENMQIMEFIALAGGAKRKLFSFLILFFSKDKG